MKNNVVSAACNELPFDLVIENVNFVNVFTKEIYRADIGIKEGRIAHVTQPGDEKLVCENSFNGEGKYAIPGLIDAHTHIECTMMTPANMAEVILPCGVTTIVCDPHEMGNVKGVDGVKYMLDASENIFLNVLIAVPSCIPSAEDVETAGAEFLEDEVREILSWDRVVALAEVMDYYGVIHQTDRMNRILSVAKEKGVFIQGHSPTVVGRDLSAYIAAGVCSCHESSQALEAEYKLRAGMVVECRKSSNLNDLKEIVPVLKKHHYPTNAVLCTDDRQPSDLLKDGSIDHLIRYAIELGIPPIEAIRMATYHASLQFHLKDCGTLRAGSRADIVLLDDLDTFKVNEVFVLGELIAKDGQMVREIEKPEFELEKENTIYLQEDPKLSDFEIKAKRPGETADVHVIAFQKEEPTVTKCEMLTLPVNSEGYVDNSNNPELCTMTVYERHGKNGNCATVFVKDFGLTEGAVATTFSHDCHNLVVIGKDKEDMLLAAKTLQDCHGGIICVNHGEVEALVELPIGGIVSPKSAKELAGEFDKLNQAMTRHGIMGDCPYIQISSLNIPVCPEVRLTDKGLVDVMTQKMIEIVKE